MKKTLRTGVIIFIFIGLVVPQMGQAYGVTDRHITRLSDTLTMYTLEFEFGFLNADMWMPITASKTLEEGLLVDSETASLILSTSTIQNKKYFVPRGKRSSFTLVVLEKHEVGKSKNALSVDSLPITIEREGKRTKRVFIKEELQDFHIN